MSNERNYDIIFEKLDEMEEERYTVLQIIEENNTIEELSSYVKLLNKEKYETLTTTDGKHVKSFPKLELSGFGASCDGNFELMEMF